jgi:nitrile hydratase accessory protein
MMTGATDPRIATIDKQIELPRKNGELVFEAPWEARAFGLAVALNEAGFYAWSDFSQGLAREIGAVEAKGETAAYYERWLAALETLILSRGLLTPEELEARVAEQALHDAHDHDHDHDHDHHHHHHHHDHHHEHGSENGRGN